jgi:ferredoxin
VLRWPLVGRFLKWPGARPFLQLPLFLLALLLVWQGISGPDLSLRNAATVLTWVHYRGALILGLLLAGNLFCLACPFMLPRRLARALATPVRPWPAALRNKWVAVLLFAAVLFGYERFALWDSPLFTAWLILGYFASALTVDLFFAQAPFCKYICPLGQFNFVTATLSPLELAVADPGVCAACATRDCIEGRPSPTGRGSRRGCELGLFQPQKRGNMDCTLCLDCVHACPHDNIALRIRVPGEELWDNGRRSGIGIWSERPDVVALVIVFTFGSLLNAFAMASPVQAVRAWTAGVWSTQDPTVFLATLFTVGLVIEPAVLLLGAAGASARAGGRRRGVLQELGHFVFALVPVGVGIWAAHYGFHLLAGLWSVVPVLQEALQPFGIPPPVEAAWHVPGLASATVLPLQTAVILLGTMASLVVAYRIAEREYPSRTAAAFVPWAVVSGLLGGAGLWVMTRPMEMRGLMVM